jgi:hypothetical protein
LDRRVPAPGGPIKTILNSFAEWVSVVVLTVSGGVFLNHLSLRLCILSSAFFSSASIRASSLWIYFLSSDSSGILAMEMVVTSQGTLDRDGVWENARRGQSPLGCWDCHGAKELLILTGVSVNCREKICKASEWRIGSGVCEGGSRELSPRGGCRSFRS